MTIACNITNPGIPPASFQWNKNGRTISYDTSLSSDSLLALTLRNVTKQDAGVYICIARNRLSYQNDQIELNVTEPLTDGKCHTADIMLILWHSLTPT